MICAWKELLSILPPTLRPSVDTRGRDTLQEIRLRRGQSVILVFTDHTVALPHNTQPDDLQYVINAACNYSPWTAETAAQGFITAPGGHRIGICGQAQIRSGVMTGIKRITSLNIRVNRDFHDISSNLWLRKENILILGPPGSGKTTLLRDLIRNRSQQEYISVVDERGEIFPPESGFEIGLNTDILTGVSKPQGITILLRTMTPNCIAVDEITAATDCEALLQAGWCGVSLLATAHAASVHELKHRPIYQPLITSGLFQTAVVMRRDKSWYTERITL